MFIDGLCRFAGLIPTGEPQKYKNSTEWNKTSVLWITCGKVSKTIWREVMHKRKTSHSTIEPLFFTIPQVAAMLGLGRSKIYDLIRDEGLPTAKFGTAVRVPAAELKDWVKQRIA